MVKQVRVTAKDETLTLSLRGELICLTVAEGRQLASDLAAALLRAGHVAWQRGVTEKAAARLVAQENEPWGLWSAGADERGELVAMGVSWPGNIVDTLPRADAERRRDEHNAALAARKGAR